MSTEGKAAWQKHFRKVPGYVIDEISRINGPIRVAGARYVGQTEVDKNLFIGLGLSSFEQLKGLDVVVVPDVVGGRYSARNVDGDIIVRRDLPKITKSFSFDAPNFGDYSRGTHTVDQDREVYQRDYFAPREISFSMRASGYGDHGRCRMELISTRVLDPSANGFDRELLFELNLLQENTGACTVIPASQGAVTERTVETVSWELLPSGMRLEEIVDRMRLSNDQERRTARDYLSVLTRLHQSRAVYVVGLGGTNRYVGMKLSPELVVFENVHYGNAIYVIRGDWESLSKLSRTELLTGHSDTIDRIPHIGSNWEMKLQNIVKARKGDIGLTDD